MSKIEEIDAVMNDELGAAMVRACKVIPHAEAKDVLASGMRFFLQHVANHFGLDAAISAAEASAEALSASRLDAEATTTARH